MFQSTADVAVVIVTHNQHDLLRNCLRSVLSAMNGVRAQVIVVDNASVDATAQVMSDEFPQVRHLRNDINVHYTRAVNQGARATHSEFVFLLNDDTELDPGCLRTLVDFMRAHPRCGAAGPKLLSPKTQTVDASAKKFPTPLREVAHASGLSWYLRNKASARNLSMTYPEPMTTQQVDWVCGGAIFLRRSVMEQLGYHDENYLFYRDDPDIGMRLKAAGFEVWYVAETHVLHHHGMSTVKTERKVKFNIIAARSRRHYFRKFHGLAGCAFVECGYGLTALLRAARSLCTLRMSEASTQWRNFTVLFASIPLPDDERAAIDGYRRMSYNGMTDASAPSESPASSAA